MKMFDRLFTIVVTATLTSAIWIVAGGSLIENATGDGQVEKARPAEAAPSPTPASSVLLDGGEGPRIPQPGEAAEALNTQVASQPERSAPGSLMVPVLNIRPADLTDTYTDSRGGGDRLHEAIDIMAPAGTSVVAASSGVVEKLFRSDAGGNTIYVRSEDGLTIYYYAHLDEYAEGLQEGQRIRRGQRLGTVGSTGNASPESPHLHFAIMRTTKDAEWWEPANAVNPFPLLTRNR